MDSQITYKSDANEIKLLIIAAKQKDSATLGGNPPIKRYTQSRKIGINGRSAGGIG